MTIVVKIGGGTGVATTNIAREIAQCVAGGQRIVVLHGASDLTNVLSQARPCVSMRWLWQAISIPSW